jgi:hypothetical protein
VLTCLILTWSFLSVGWFRPNWLRAVGAALMAIGDGFERFRHLCETNFRDYRKGTPPTTPKPPAAPIAINPVDMEVVEALVSQGCGKRQAREAAARAIASLPAGSGFNEIFARAAMKEAA